MSMNDLVWEGTYGYGDAIGCITNALWIDHIGAARGKVSAEDTKRVLVRWHKDRKWCPPQKKYHPDDPETILKRWMSIKEFFVGHEKIHYHMVDYDYNGPARDRRSYEHRWNTQQWWSTVWEHKFNTYDGGYICMWVPEHNVDNLTDEYGTAYKDPLTIHGTSKENQWPRLMSSLERRGVVKYINYRMPVEEVFETIAGASICYGYEGIGQMIAKNMWKPMVTYSGLDSVSKRTGGPWQFITDTLHEHDLDIDRVIQLQKKMIADCKKNYEHHLKHKK